MLAVLIWNSTGLMFRSQKRISKKDVSERGLYFWHLGLRYYVLFAAFFWTKIPTSLGVVPRH